MLQPHTKIYSTPAMAAAADSEMDGLAAIFIRRAVIA
jgi:hypothetical protein